MKRLLIVAAGILVVGGIVLVQVGKSETADAVACLYSKQTAISGSGLYTVPAGCTKMKIKLWGNGGNSYVTTGNNVLPGGIMGTGAGGGGGFVLAEINTTPGTVYVATVNAQSNAHGDGGGASFLQQQAQQGYIAIAGGGGGGAGSPSGYSQLGRGGAGGGHAAEDGTAGIQGSNNAGAGKGGSDTAGGAGGTSSSGSCAGGAGSWQFGGGGSATCWYGGTGGTGASGGGGGSAILPNNPAIQYSVGGGGGGASNYLLSGSYDSVVNFFVRGNQSTPGNPTDPDYALPVGRGGPGGTGVTWPNHMGKPGRIVLIFGEDLTVNESAFPPGMGASTLCGGGYNTATPTGFPYPLTIPQFCTARNMTCRGTFDDPNDVVCRYQCNADPDSVYVFRNVCP